jgi:hypothetical protein
MLGFHDEVGDANRAELSGKLCGFAANDMGQSQAGKLSQDFMRGAWRWGGSLTTFGIQTLLVYASAVHLSPWLVYHWFGWIAPILRISISIPATDWYLQHLELVTTSPAAIVGYISITRFHPFTVGSLIGKNQVDSIAVWAWVVPSIVLGYKMLLLYHAPTSVLYPTSVSAAIKYFFDIQTVMPTRENLFTIDPERVLTQMTITAPFYSGVAYSFGAWASKHRLLVKVFGSGKPKA